MECTESKFAHLLQPIRELTKNWDIDVASELNDYLEELDEMCITFDDGKLKLNFAEAALLIQGSTSIYSKKVELLYNLVYQTLEYINDKNKKKNKQKASDGENGDGDMDEDVDEEFSPMHLEASTKSEKEDSDSPVSVVPLPPESLIPTAAKEKSKLPLISLKGELLCSLKDFRINVFFPGEEDMIILTSGCLAHRLRQRISFNQLHTPQQQEPVIEAVDGAVDGVVDGVMDGVVAPVENGIQAEDDFLPLEENNMEMEMEPEHVDRQQAPAEPRLFRERRHLEEEKLKEREEPPIVDVWEFHDPYAILEQDKPFKAGKVYKVPDGLSDGGKRKRKPKSSALQDFGSWVSHIFNPPEPKLKNGPTYTELNYVYMSTIKDRVKAHRRINGRRGIFTSEEAVRNTLLEIETEQKGEEPVDALGLPNLPGAEEEEDFSDGENNDGFPNDGPAEFNTVPEPQGDELSYEDLVKLRVEQLVVNSQGYTQETSLSRRVKEWEENIKPVLQSQEQCPRFDIRDFESRIVSSLSEVGERKSFASIVSGLDNYTACKYLLASLQLANDETVEIDSASGLEESVDSMGLTLLSMLRATDRFKTLP